MHWRRLSALLLLPLVVGAPATAQDVEAVELHLGPGLVQEEVLPAVVIEVGQPLDGAQVRRTLDNLATLFETARAAVWRSPTATGGWRVHVSVEPKLQVVSVVLDGNLGLRREDLLAVLEQAAGAPLVEGRLLRSVYALQDLFDRNGYLARSVQLDVELLDAGRADVVFRVDAGPRSEIVGADFRGELKGLPLDELERALGLPAGQKYSPRTEAVARRRAQAWLRERGYLEARLGDPEFDYRREDSTLRLVYSPRLGRPVRLEIVGVDRDSLEKGDLLPFDGDGIFDRSLLPRTEQRILDHLQSRGHSAARVGVSSEPIEAGLRVVIDVEPGPRRTLLEVAFEGNVTIPPERLRRLVETSEKRRFAPSTGTLIDSRVAADESNVEAFLVRQGYLASTVTHRAEELGDDGLRLVFVIDEGPRSLVSNVELDGGGVVLPSDLEPEGEPLVGFPFHPGLRSEVTGRLLESLERRGYRRPRIDVEAAEVTAGLHELRVQVQPGPRTVVDRVVVRGAGRTERSVVVEAVGLQPDQPIAREQLLEAQRRLYRLGIFKRAEVRLGSRTLGVGSQGDDLRDVIVDVEEARRWRLGYGVGFDSDDGVGGLFSLTRSNLLRRGSTLRLDLNLTEREKRARLLFSDRPFDQVELPVRYAVYRLEESFSAFDSARYGAQIESSIPVTRRLRLGLFYDYRIVELDVTRELPLTAFDRDLIDTEVSSLTTTLFYDRRNDPLDPSSGWSSAVQLEGAFPLLEADERFVKAFGQLTGYLPLGRFGVLGGSLRVGAIEPLDDLPADALLAQSVPISERFFAGGRTSHRAYRRDRLGIDGETVIQGFEIGGEGLALINVDYRFPLAGPLGGTLFVDTGNVWATRGDVSFDDFETGVGVGVRYRSPIGPLRLEVAWKLDREPGESSPLYLVSFGHAF